MERRAAASLWSRLRAFALGSGLKGRDAPSGGAYRAAIHPLRVFVAKMKGRQAIVRGRMPLQPDLDGWIGSGFAGRCAAASGGTVLSGGGRMKSLFLILFESQFARRL